MPVDVPTVAAAVAPRIRWQPLFAATANLSARLGAELSFQTPGILSEYDVAPGQAVAAGTVIARLAMTNEPGVLAGLRAQVALDQLTFDRASSLFGTRVASAASLDQARLALQADQARVLAEQEMIDTRTLRAPFAGRVGIRRADPGQFLPAGTPLVSLQATETVHADFPVPQDRAEDVHPGDPVSLAINSWPGRSFPGRIAAAMPELDRRSRTLLMRAELDNRDGALLPGMFATVRVLLPGGADRVVLPTAAIVFATWGDSVWILRSAAGGGPPTAHQVPVRIGEQRGDQVEVLSGLDGGETVVDAGQNKLSEGAAATVDEAGRPDADPEPHPDPVQD